MIVSRALLHPNLLKYLSFKSTISQQATYSTQPHCPALPQQQDLAEDGMAQLTCSDMACRYDVNVTPDKRKVFMENEKALIDALQQVVKRS